MFELVPLLGRADWAKAWLQYCRLGAAPAEVLEADRATGTEGADARYVEPAQGGPRLAAYAYAQTKNAAFATRAIAALARNRGANPVAVATIDALNPVHESPFVSTNDAAQSSLTAIEILALCAGRIAERITPGAGRRIRRTRRPTGWSSWRTHFAGRSAKQKLTRWPRRGPRRVEGVGHGSNGSSCGLGWRPAGRQISADWRCATTETRSAFDSKWCQRPGLNRRPKAYESSALPLSYSGIASGETCPIVAPSPIKSFTPFFTRRLALPPRWFRRG